MNTLWQDLRYAVRTLLKNPGFTCAALIALALGIGANTAIFSVVNAVLLRPLQFEHQERLVSIYGVSANSDGGRFPLSYPDFVDYQKGAQSLQYIAAYSLTGTSLVNSSDEPESLSGAVASAELFPLLGVAPKSGRVFTREEDKPGAAPVIVLSEGLWQRRFNSDTEIVGRHITIGGRSTTVLGVMPADFKFPVDALKVDYWMPLAADPGAAAFIERRGGRFLNAVAGLKPGVTIDGAEAELNTIAANLEKQYPGNTGVRAEVLSLREDLVGDIRPALLVLLGAVILVLLIACANVANLLLARATARGREMALRSALGASRARVMRQLLQESVLLALTGGALGLLLALRGIDLLVALSPDNIPRVKEIALDSRVLLFTLGVSLVTGIGFGIAPALQASNTDLNETLKEGGRGSTTGRRRQLTRSLLVISEVALSLMLLVGAGLLIKSFVRLLKNDPGYDTKRVLTVNVPLSRTKYPQPEGQANFFQQVLERLSVLPGVEAVGATNLLPLSGNDSISTFTIEGRPPVVPGQEPDARQQTISPDFFRALSIPLRQGRDFTARDTATQTLVIIVNETFARRFFPGENPIGKRIRLDNEAAENKPPREIVGIVGDTRHGGLGGTSYASYYFPYLQRPARNMTLAVRSNTSDPAALTASVRNALRELDRNQLIGEAQTMNTLVSRTVAPRRFNMLLLGVFALIALVLAAVGIFGVMNYAVTQRTHEIGIRLALGAQKIDVLRLIVGSGMKLILIGVSLGLAGAFASTRVMASLLYGVSATDTFVFTGISALLAFVALVACYIPARRATKVDPMIALRYE
ncbi:ABC transporter permease [soil metagenome]